MAISKKPYKGCRDFFPTNMRVRDYLFHNMKSTAESFAFEAYDGPLLEEVELYKAKSGEELINDQIYSFTDRGKREVAIRPEMTPTIARMVAAVHRQTPKPIRWYSIPNLMRYERPQRGRLREHWQFNVDVFGAPENLGEIEVLSLVVQFLKNLGATKEMFSIQINDRRIVDTIFTELFKLNQEDSLKLYKVVDAAKKLSAEKLDEKIDEIIKNSDIKDSFKTYLAIDSFEGILDFLKENKLETSCASFLNLTTLADKIGIQDYLNYDPTIVRGLDYYTGIVFEVFDNHPDNRRAIAGGGAYANLLGIFDEGPLAGVGFGMGDVTLVNFLETHKILPNLDHAANDLYVTYTNTDQEIDSIKLANELRARGLKVELNPGQIKFNKIFKTAESKNHKVVAIIEEKDGEAQVQVKNLNNQNSEFFKLSNIENIVSFLKKEK